MKIAILNYEFSQLDVLNIPEGLDISDAEKIDNWLADEMGYSLEFIQWMILEGPPNIELDN